MKGVGRALLRAALTLPCEESLLWLAESLPPLREHLGYALLKLTLLKRTYRILRSTGLRYAGLPDHRKPVWHETAGCAVALAADRRFALVGLATQSRAFHVSGIWKPVPVAESGPGLELCAAAVFVRSFNPTPGFALPEWMPCWMDGWEEDGWLSVDLDDPFASDWGRVLAFDFVQGGLASSVNPLEDLERVLFAPMFGIDADRDEGAGTRTALRPRAASDPEDFRVNAARGELLIQEAFAAQKTAELAEWTVEPR
jgi:hypothetical protein